MLHYGAIGVMVVTQSHGGGTVMVATWYWIFKNRSKRIKYVKTCNYYQVCGIIDHNLLNIYVALHLRDHCNYHLCYIYFCAYNMKRTVQTYDLLRIQVLVLYNMNNGIVREPGISVVTRACQINKYGKYLVACYIHSLICMVYTGNRSK